LSTAILPTETWAAYCHVATLSEDRLTLSGKRC
jgi:hypothetical protein